jgi:hypothetical protein
MKNNLLNEEIKRFFEIVEYRGVIEESLAALATKAGTSAIDDIIKKTLRDVIEKETKEFTMDALQKRVKNGIALPKIATDPNVLKGIMTEPNKVNLLINDIQGKIAKELNNPSYVMSGLDKSVVRAKLIDAADQTSRKFIQDTKQVLKTGTKETVQTGSKEVAQTAARTGAKETGQSAVSQASKTASKDASQGVVKTFKPGEVINSSSFVDSAVDWSKVTNAKNMLEYNKLIANALKTGDFSLISRSGFEKYGIDNFREFLQRGVNKEKNIMFDPPSGKWYFQHAEFPKTPSKLLTDADDLVVQSSINNIKKEAAQEVDDIVKIATSPDKALPKNKSKIINFLENKKILTIDPTTGKKKLTKRGYAVAIGLGIGGVYLIGALSENGVDVDPEVKEQTDTTGGGGSGESGSGGGGVTGWRSLGKQYDDQIKTALGLPTDTQLTDADIDTLYNKLKEIGKI